jgi:hypothetical protein
MFSALEALGNEAERFASGGERLGIVFCAMCGCVNYSRRFYDETLRDPATASPLVFPETVFNAPASHLGSFLGARSVNYTLVGDPGTFIQGLALAGHWLRTGIVDACLVVAAEEIDWLTAEATHLFDRQVFLAEGGGALYLDRRPGGVVLDLVTNSHLFGSCADRRQAASKARADLGRSVSGEILCDGIQDAPRTDGDEWAVWSDWGGRRISPKRVLGEGLTAAAAWQCIAAVDAMGRWGCPTAIASVVGCNQQAIAARFRTAG